LQALASASEFDEHDRAWMAEALRLAEAGWGRVHPNPMVGAVLVHNSDAVGRGFHAEFGGEHAEVVALREAGCAARGATLYTTLEPCTHQGKQPPCVDAILGAGVERVVVAACDPNPDAAGGVARLRAAGISVATGCLGQAADRLNFRFRWRFGERRRPFVAVKLAVSMDGMVADRQGRSQWLSGPEMQQWVHHVRAGFAALGVGGTTAANDGTRLTVRGDVRPLQAPRRVLFDRSGMIRAGHPVFTDVALAPLTIIAGPGVAEARRSEWRLAGADVAIADDLDAGLDHLLRLDVDSILVEGGGRLAGALLRQELVDRVYQIQCPLWLGEGRPAWANLGRRSLGMADRWQVTDVYNAGNAGVLLTLER
jgi:diaminohydroxyphosphoribosylaminopyrimidine deaminase/5-amino-6-(5-phosphoribosylamino)uracil reductase